MSNSGRQDAEDLGNSYFDELVNRSMIQPEEIDYNGKVLSCRVHDMMLDLILSKCTEGNFISVLYDSQGMRELQNSKVRRLSLNLNSVEGFTILHCSVQLLVCLCVHTFFQSQDFSEFLSFSSGSSMARTGIRRKAST